MITSATLLNTNPTFPNFQGNGNKGNECKAVVSNMHPPVHL